MLIQMGGGNLKKHIFAKNQLKQTRYLLFVD